MSDAWKLLLFGGSGAIGQAISSHARGAGWQVVATRRGAAPEVGDPDQTWLSYDPAADPLSPAPFAAHGPFDAVCWAQGANIADNLNDFDSARHLALYQANVLFVLQSASALVEHGLLRREGAKLCVISSIWQERARQNKLSYTVTKAAIGGLVRAASVDLAAAGHLINGVLPGVLDTAMTAANLSPAQIDAVRAKTPFGRLPDLDTLADLVLMLCGRSNNSISGQSIAVDLGMGNASLI